MKKLSLLLVLVFVLIAKIAQAGSYTVTTNANQDAILQRAFTAENNRLTSIGQPAHANLTAFVRSIVADRVQEILASHRAQDRETAKASCAALTQAQKNTACNSLGKANECLEVCP